MLWRTGFLFLVAALVGMPVAAFALETSVNGDLILFQGYRTIRAVNASQYQSIDDSELVAGLGVKFEVSSWVLDIKGRFVGAYGDSLSVPSTDPAYLDIDPPPRFFNWVQKTIHSSYFQSYTDVDKAYLMYQKNNFEFSVGRRAVGLGTLKYLPIWNRFVPSVGQVGGPALIYNPDNVQMSYQHNKVAISGIQIQGQTSADSLSTLLNTWYLNSIEIHFLLGSWWERGTGGIAFSKDIEGLTLRGESLFFQEDILDKNMQAQLGLGFEYAFNPKVSVVMEGMYSSVGASNKSEYLKPPRDKFAILNANAYLFTTLEYLPRDFWKISGGALVNLMDKSWLGIGEIKYSWSNNLDLSFQIKQPVGGSEQEFGADFYPIKNDNNDAYIGYSAQLAFQLNYYF